MRTFVMFSKSQINGGRKAGGEGRKGGKEEGMKGQGQRVRSRGQGPLDYTHVYKKKCSEQCAVNFRERLQTGGPSWRQMTPESPRVPRLPFPSPCPPPLTRRAGWAEGKEEGKGERKSMVGKRRNTENSNVFR